MSAKLEQFVLKSLQQNLLTEDQPPALTHFFVALSGGLDSSVLLHVLVKLAEQLDIEITALHFDHGLQQNSASWAEFCAERASFYSIPFLTQAGSVQINPKQGLESSARDARYHWFARAMSSSRAPVLFTGHHADDQAETMLINLLRGTGVAGLRGIARLKKQNGYTIMRPLLDWTRQQLLDYARQEQLQWIEDPSNQDTTFTRNSIRQQLMPPLRELRQNAARQFVKTSDHMRAAYELLTELAQQDLQSIQQQAFCPLDQSFALCLLDLRGLSEVRLRNVLQHWLQSVGYPANDSEDVRQLCQWTYQGTTAAATLRRGSREYRYYRGYMYVMPHKPLLPHMKPMCWQDLSKPLLLTELSAELVCLEPDQFSPGTELQVRFREQQQQILLPDGSGHVDIRKRFQEVGVPQWRRDLVPLVFMGKELLVIPGGQESDQRRFFLRTISA
ncbi:MAG: tRNA lysidine(34) synthetase TilS [Arenicella sp.]